MTLVAEITGYAFMATCGWGALLWTWEKFATATWKRCLDSEDFYSVVIEYAKIRKRRKNNRIGFSDE
jgi:hypothetical protein